MSRNVLCALSTQMIISLLLLSVQSRINVSYLIKADYHNELNGLIDVGPQAIGSTLLINITNWNHTAFPQTTVALKRNGYSDSSPTIRTCSSGTIQCIQSYPITVSGNYYFSFTLSSYAQFYKAIVETYTGTNVEAKTVIKKVVYQSDNPAIQKTFYVKDPDTFYFSISPITSLMVQIYSISPQTQWSYRIINKIGIASLDSSLTNSSTKVFKIDLAAGYYQIRLFGAFGTDLTFTWQTDPFSCLRDPAFQDYFQMEKGCTIPNPIDDLKKAKHFSTLPCLAYSIQNVTSTWNETINETEFTNSSWAMKEVCSLCMNGYTLENGICKVNTTCPKNQYFHFGKCYAVSPLCGKYEPFTGNCLTCASPNTHILTNGICVQIQVNCNSRQWQANATCLDVNESCEQFDLFSGNCFTCKNSSFLLTNGTCKIIVIDCPLGQYEKDQKCLTIPSECLDFDKITKKCIRCMFGYYIQGEFCQRIVCPFGKIPSKLGLNCIEVSPLCEYYNQIEGTCISCKYADYSLSSSGQCLKVVTPLAGCRERQKLGFGPCRNPEQNCRYYNLQTGNCEACDKGYEFSYTGKCEYSSICPTNKWSISGQCLSFPVNCLKINKFGLCIQCINDQFKLISWQCIRYFKCSQNQYLNQNSICIDASPLCATFNPTNGECITCLDENIQPFLGVCCPLGKINHKGACVEDILDNSKLIGSCRIMHPLLGYCLSCYEGYEIDPATSTNCIEI